VHEETYSARPSTGISASGGARVAFVQANGTRFGYLEEGQGPLVLLFHGFPDTAHTWDAVRARVADRGFRAVTPFLRGYAPSSVPEDAKYAGG
jgi:pimeloyl-ACP methyl ester carboxylesterase